MEMAIDTSTDYAALALSSCGEVIAEVSWNAGQNHTAELVPHLISLMEHEKVSVKNLGGVIVARGPGSFNGLRAGITTAKGIAYAQNVPVVGVSSLEVEAYQYAENTFRICAIAGVGRGEIAAAIFQKKNGEWIRHTEEHITVVSTLVTQIKERTVFCGRIPDHVAVSLKESLGEDAVILHDPAEKSRMKFLAELGWKRLKNKDFDNLTALQPLYLRKPSITKSKKCNIPTD